MKALFPFYLLTFLSLAFLLSACTVSNPTAIAPVQTGVAIDWVNVIHMRGITYMVSSPNPTLTSADLGPVFGTTTFKVDGNIHDPQYHLKDGDATYLPAGTPVYTVKGHPSSVQLAAYVNGVITLYKALRS